MQSSWLYVVQESGRNQYRWFVLNRHGELIDQSAQPFRNEADAKKSLSDFLILMGQDTAA